MKTRDTASMSPLAQEIHRRMTELQKTQKGLALEAGLSATYVRDLYDGTKKSATVDKLQAIARVLNCTVGELLGEGGADLANPIARRAVAQKIYDVIAANLEMMVAAEIARLDSRSLEDFATAITQTIMDTALALDAPNRSADLTSRTSNVVDLYQARRAREG